MQLYDLMTMGFKYQLLGCAQPSDMLQVTLNHFDFLADVVRGSEVQPLVEKARSLVVEVCVLFALIFHTYATLQRGREF